MKLKAYAKINLGLDVIRKREDGYHDLRMIMQTIDLYDETELEPISAQGVFELVTNCPELPLDERNLMVKAAKIMWEEYSLTGGLQLSLIKNIPMAAGLAGGSTDAAAVLKGIDRLFHLQLPTEELLRVGKKIGADVPYCIMGGTCLAEGIGEILTPLPDLPKVPMVLLKPDFDVSTGYVYKNLKIAEISNHPEIDEQVKAIASKDVKSMASYMGNVLESVTVKKYPEIEAIKENMISCGAHASMMSGSGPSVYGLFSDMEKAQSAKEILSEKYPDAAVYATTFIRP